MEKTNVGDIVFVQAWECKGEAFSGYVYDSGIMLDKVALGCGVESVTIVRHPDGSREFLNGTVMGAVVAHRYGGKTE